MKQIFHNNKKSKILTIFVCLFLFLILVIPIIFFTFLNSTIIYDFFKHNYLYFFVVIFFYVFFINAGIYKYKLKFEDSSFLVKSSRTIGSYFGSKLFCIELSNEMLIGYSFLKRKNLITDVLLLKMVSNSGKRSAKRIPMTLLSQLTKDKISNLLDNIIQKNKCQKK